MNAISKDDPTPRDKNLTMSVRKSKTMRDGCMTVVCGERTVRVFAYSEPMFEYDKRDGSFEVKMPFRQQWVVQKINACLRGLNCPVRAFSEETYVGFVDANGVEIGRINLGGSIRIGGDNEEGR